MLAGFVPGLPYAIAFGIGMASAVVSALESDAKGDQEKITVPAGRRDSCVDVLRWYLDEARATCEHLAAGAKDLSERLPGLFDEVKKAAVAKDAHIPGELNALLP